MSLKTMMAVLVILSLLGTLVMCSAEPPIQATYTGQGFVLQYSNGSPLNLTSRATIYDFILRNPGTHFRNICTSLGLSIGTVQYHLEQLVEGELIESEKESRYKRFFISRRFSGFEKLIISFLQKPMARKIIKYTSSPEGFSHQELVHCLGVSSQAVTWHVKRLMDEGILESEMIDNSTYYYTTGKARISLDKLGYLFSCDALL